MSDEKRLSENEIGLTSPDLKLTLQEWVFFWKSRFEAATAKIVLAQQWIEQRKEQMQSMAQEIGHLRKANEELAAQLKTLQGQRQEAANEEGGAPGGVVKKFKRGKKK